MKLINSTNVTEGVTFSAGYSNDCSVMIVHAKPPTVPPNEKSHYHTKDSEYFYILKGELELLVNDKKITVSVGQCLVAEPKEIHKIVGLKNGTEYMVIRTNFLPGEKVIVKS